MNRGTRLVLEKRVMASSSGLLKTYGGLEP